VTMPGGAKAIETIAPLDAILDAHAAEIGGDLTRYRNHCYRVANLCAAQSPSSSTGGGDDLEKIGIAVAFHDLGIWTDHTFDYLEPSVALAQTWLIAHGRQAWEPEVSEIIRQHHKLTRYTGAAGPLVEPFRRSDWIDVTGGLLRFGVPRAFIRSLYARWPSAGFHRLLVKLELRHLSRHPLNPLPVFKL
jgi:hypothetical protein